MERDYSEPLRQIISNVKKYSAASLDEFLDKKNLVNHDKRGIVVTLEGNYSLSIQIREEPEELFNEIPSGKLEYITYKMEIYSLLEQFPYISEGLNFILHPYLFESGKLKIQEQNRVSIINPQLHLMKDKENNEIVQLLDINMAQRKKRKDKKDLLLKILQFQNQ